MCRRQTARAFFSGTINTRLVAEYEALTSVQSFARMFNGLRRYLWPSGVFYTPALLPSEEEKARQRYVARTASHTATGR